MKKLYIDPELEIVEFKVKGSVLNASAPTEQPVTIAPIVPSGEPTEPAGPRE